MGAHFRRQHGTQSAIDRGAKGDRASAVERTEMSAVFGNRRGCPTI